MILIGPTLSGGVSRLQKQARVGHLNTLRAFTGQNIKCHRDILIAMRSRRKHFAVVVVQFFFIRVVAYQ